jgi:nucleoside-diphosphate-sugar epimerase
MKVLVLGATGNVGSRLIPALLAHHHEVVAYVRSASKIPPDVSSKLVSVIQGVGTDSAAIKAAILANNCDAVINAAGLAAPTSLHQTGQFPEIFAAVVKAAVEARQERGGPPLRCWFLSGWSLLDSPEKPYIILD